MTPEQNTTRSPDELLVAQAKSRSDLNSMNTSNEERERLKRLAEAASPGPWRVAPPWSGFSEIRAADDGLVFGLAAGEAGERRGENECDANALFLAAANPLAILSLIAENEAQAARVKALEVALGDVINPLGKIKRDADAQGRQLSGMAYSIANSLSFVQGIAKAALQPSEADHGR